MLGNLPTSLPTYSYPFCPFCPFSEPDEDDIGTTTNATVFGSGPRWSHTCLLCNRPRHGLGLRVCVSNGGRRRVRRAGRLVGWLVLDYSALGSALGSHSPKHKREDLQSRYCTGYYCLDSYPSMPPAVKKSSAASIQPQALQLACAECKASPLHLHQVI